MLNSSHHTTRNEALGFDAGTSSEFIETVRPDDGRLETLWVWLFIAAVLAIGAIGISVRTETHVHVPSVELNPVEQQLLTELSIAIQEIEFVTGDVGDWPDIDQLIMAQIPPFTHQSQTWRAIEKGCYLLVSAVGMHGHFMLDLNEEARILFHESPIPMISECHDLSHWHRLDTLK
ncbi:hypothetical protein DN062_12610 [Nitrincola tibetensis]|uniref:Uncharacterized protein n=1 Tax=Nitrincola tibetensis TaxID=2219697 RepID=A0A364NKX9_9GAMM|nr:hypothetical protein [Nitrincola tibetensis]RAU17527.1 hypothetical protein DN062_12610 [Nitrincola tibetensis]